MNPFTSLQLMINLWQLGIVDSLTLTNFVANVAAQYSTFAGVEFINTNSTIPSVLLSPVMGLVSTSPKFVRMGANQAIRNQRIATIGSFVATSILATFTDKGTSSGAGAAAAGSFSYMRAAILANNTGGLVFCSPTVLSKISNQNLIDLDIILIGGFSIIIATFYVLPKIGKLYWHISHKIADKLVALTFCCTKKINKIRKWKNSKKYL